MTLIILLFWLALTPCPAALRASRPGKPFDSMNGIAAMMLLNMTSSVRFEGSLNVDLNDITMNLVPFPQVCVGSVWAASLTKG